MGADEPMWFRNDVVVVEADVDATATGVVVVVDAGSGRKRGCMWPNDGAEVSTDRDQSIRCTVSV